MSDAVPAPFYVPLANADNSELRLRRHIENKYNINFDGDYERWYRWTCDNAADFWSEIADFCRIPLFSPRSGPVVETRPFHETPRWFVGATTNYAAMCLEHPVDDIAIIQASNHGSYRYITFGELRADVAALAIRMRDSMNVRPGDSVCGFITNCYEAAAAMLATAAIGAVWSSCSTDFGKTGVLDRFAQVKPKVLFTVRRVSYKSKQHSLDENLNMIIAGLPSLTHVVIVDTPTPLTLTNGNIWAPLQPLEHDDKCVAWSKLVAEASGQQTKLDYEPCAFDHPLFTLFSSGTTGVPKGIVHGQGNVLLKHAEEHLIQENVQREDRMFFYTTTGWMMYNWLVSVLIAGASIVLYDESPLEPDVDVLIKICAETHSTMFGAGAKLFDEYAKRGLNFNKRYDLSRLRMVLSTASPLRPTSFHYINQHIKTGVVIGSISGGTDIDGVFVGTTLNRPVVAGECQHYYLGVDMAALDADGEPTLDRRGELVCRRPFPSAPVCFVNDADGSRYRRAYFEQRAGFWTHGDFVMENSNTNGMKKIASAYRSCDIHIQGVTIFGRSDTTLNRGGVRIGTAEVYNVVEQFTEVADSVVVGRVECALIASSAGTSIEEENERVHLFVRMNDNQTLTDELRTRICRALRAQMSPRHVPDAIDAIADIPYTGSGKKVELAVKQILNNEEVKNVGALRNPESLDLYRCFSISRT